jgi:PiT family inorganic phosphate transporter
MILLFLSSGLFLGWSLGANDAANVFGTAVATRMVRFRTAAITSGLFVIVGAVLAGGGATRTLGQLGSVNAMAGAFMVALAAALAVLWMTRAGLPVSVSQAIIGGIIGWNLFTGSPTDIDSLVKIVSTWVICPLLSGVFAAGLYVLARAATVRSRMHLLAEDALTRAVLIAVGAFGAFSLGANNIANVMGVFVSAIPASSVHLLGFLHVSSDQQLFALGGIAIAVGIFTYSHRVMMTVGKGLFRLTPMTGLVVILSESLVLFLFASELLESWLISHGLPSIPLVPVSSSQAVIGAVIGIALVKGGRNLDLRLIRRIAGGWVATPVIAALVAFFGLFFLQNVFDLPVHRPVSYELSEVGMERLQEHGVHDEGLAELEGAVFETGRELSSALKEKTSLGMIDREVVVECARKERFVVTLKRIETLDLTLLTVGQIRALRELSGREFGYSWELESTLAAESDHWAMLPDTRDNHLANKRLRTNLRQLLDAFRTADTND